jgi:hypothetical protein
MGSSRQVTAKSLYSNRRMPEFMADVSGHFLRMRVAIVASSSDKVLSAALTFICGDMWKPYLQVVAKKAGHALHILDRFISPST